MSSSSLASALIVDDDPLACEVLRAYLQRCGLTQIDMAPSARAALAAIRTSGRLPDVICCDLNMPEIDGVEFIGHLRDVGYRGLVLVVSGASAPVAKAAVALATAYGLRFGGYFKKPVDFALLRDALNAPGRPASPSP